MHRAKKPTITDLNQHLTCKLCKGYFIDATTIIECLHSFCRSCIVKYLEKNKYCPVCDVQVHKTKPLLNIRPDQTLQNIVYKLVPRLYQNEIQRRRDFYLSHPESGPDQMEENYQHIVVPDESISLTMCYYGCKESARYLRCPAAVSVGHLQKLIRAKYGLFDNHHVDILYNQDCLNSALTLMDVAYIYSWKRKAPLELSYRIYQYTAKKLKLEEEKTEEKSEEEKKEEIATPTTTHNNNNNNWKEVQLRISENGEMSIIQDEALELVNNNNYKPEIVTIVDNNKVTKKELPELKFIGKCVTIQEPVIPTSCVSTSCVTLSTSTSTKTVFSTINTSKCSVSSEPPKRKIEEEEKKPEKPEETNKNNQNSTTEKGVKRKLDPPTVPEQPIKQQKQTILNHSLGLHNLSNNHPLKKHSQSNQQKTELADEFTKSKNNPVVGSNRPGTPKPVSKPCYMPKPVINVPKPGTSVAGGVANAKPPPKPLPASVCPTNQTPPAQNKLIKSKASTPIGYKTLRDPPKSWNSQIAKANVNKPVPDPKYADLKNVRPAKFFKMRNNMPRYLGNPASGVKPMYQVHVSPEKEKKPAETTPKGEIKKHSIVKIDPKTLKPISEKAPETSSLSNSSTTTSTDLKINTSSVSIFNPLKLQNSPKERKSPKSPHSPKTTSTAAKVPSSPPNKREKLNLNFTPSNPFIPNLTSPTVSPNQFLYPPGPPGFPSYDPRVMAAYHNLFYGQRMGFSPPGLNLDLNRGKNFELPKVGGLPQLKMPTQVHSTTSSTTTSTTATTTTNSSTTYKPVVKKSKESSNKSEKSLQNAVEKLTQNRVKEIKNEAAAAMKTTSTTATTTTTVTVTTSASVSVAAAATTTTATTTSSKKPEEEKKEEEKIDGGDNQTKKITESEEKSSKTSTEATVETATVTEKGEEKAKTAKDEKNDKKTVSDAEGEVQVKKGDDNKEGDDKK